MRRVLSLLQNIFGLENKRKQMMKIKNKIYCVKFWR